LKILFLIIVKAFDIPYPKKLKKSEILWERYLQRLREFFKILRIGGRISKGRDYKDFYGTKIDIN
jgi:hypothetical protein